MLTLLALYLAGIISGTPVPAKEIPNIDAIRVPVASMVGIDQDSGSSELQVGLALRTCVLEALPEFSLPHTRPTSNTLYAQDENGCAPTGDVLYELTVGDPGAPVVTTSEILYTCENGSVIKRTMTRSTTYRTITQRWTYNQTSPIPGVVCPPQVVTNNTTELASDTYDYSYSPTCPGECCYLVSSSVKYEYDTTMIPEPQQVKTEPHECPDGTMGKKITLSRNMLNKYRVVRTDRYVPNCPGTLGSDCPPHVVPGPWIPFVAQWYIQTKIDCDGSDDDEDGGSKGLELN
jgi:hypothetical protein